MRRHNPAHIVPLAWTVLFGALLPALVTLTACGGGGGGGGGAGGTLDIPNAVPQSTAGVAISVQVRIVDSAGAVESGNTSNVTAAIGTNAGGGTLSGTTSVAAVAGIATFSDLSIDKSGAGYTFAFTGSDLTGATSNPFNVVAGPPTALQFATQPQSGSTFSDTPATVRIVDANENLVASAGMDVTVEFEDNPGELILHASGISDPDSGDPTDGRLFELIDPSIPSIVHWLPGNTGDNEITVVLHNPFTGELHAINRGSDNFYTGSSETGDLMIVGAGTVDNVKGIAFESGAAARMLTVLRNTDELQEINPADGTLSLIGTLVPDMGTLDGITGLVHNANDDTFYGAANLDDLALVGRAFVQVFPTTLMVTHIGDTLESVAGLAIGGDGTVYAVTGDGSSTAETLFTVDPATGELTPLLTLGNGGDGEAIAMIPAHLRGAKTVQTVDGVASFPDLQVSAAANGYTLRATASGLAPATSSPFNATAATPGGTVQFSSSDQTVSETDGSVSIELDIDVAQPHDIIVTMVVEGTADGSAEPSPDHMFDTTFYFQITIEAGQMTGSGTIALVDDADAEGDETIQLAIADASLASAIGAIDFHTVTVTSDE